MPLDLTTLTVKDSEPPKSAARGREPMPNPFMEPVMESYRTEQAKSVIVPNGTETNKDGSSLNVVTVLGLIRRAANVQGIGVRTETVEKSATRTEIRFLGKVKTERTRKPKDGDVAVDAAPDGEPVTE
jgi:hypothetical protein